jgi:hypothetical protein
MMRPLVSLVLCGAIGAPGAALSQDIPHLAQLPPPSESPPSPVLAPLPTVAPTEPAPAAVTAAPPPIAEAGPPAPELPPPEKVAPVIVAKESKGGGVGAAVGTTAVGVAGGAAGAAVAGPVGKFAGGFLFKRIAQGLFGKRDKTPSLTVTEQTPSAATAAAPAADKVPAKAGPQTLLAGER